MNNETDFTLLAKFLEQMDPEVMGRDSSLTDDERQLIEQFAAGNLGEKERAELLPVLMENETAIALLAKLA